MRLSRRIPAFAFLSAVTLFCERPAPNPRVQAERFIGALNAGEVDSLLRFSADTMLFREQRWESASDGSGFSLGAATDTVVSGAEAKRAFFTGLVGRVHVKGTTAVERPPSRESILSEQLNHADPRWAGLEFFLFLRGEGDVEHTALIGIDPATHTVAAFYIN